MNHSVWRESRSVRCDVVRRRGGGDGVEEGGTQGCTDLLGGVDHRTRDTRVSLVHLGQGGTAQSGEGQTEPEAHDDLLGKEVGPVRRVHPDLGQPQQTQGRHDKAGGDGDARSDLGQQVRCRPGGDDHAEGEGKEGDPGFGCRVMKNLLHVVAHEDEHGEHTHDEEQCCQVRAAPIPFRDNSQRQQRRGGASLYHDKRSQKDHAHRDQRERGRRRPTVGDRLGESVDQADQSSRREQRAWDVVSGCPAGPALTDDPPTPLPLPARRWER